MGWRLGMFGIITEKYGLRLIMQKKTRMFILELLAFPLLYPYILLDVWVHPPELEYNEHGDLMHEY